MEEDGNKKKGGGEPKKKERKKMWISIIYFFVVVVLLDSYHVVNNIILNRSFPVLVFFKLPFEECVLTDHKDDARRRVGVVVVVVALESPKERNG